MKKIVIIGIIVAGAIALWLLYVGLYMFLIVSPYPDSEGWDVKRLQDDEFQAFLPITLANGLYMVSPDVAGIKTKPISEELAFVEYRDNTMSGGITILQARRSFYGHEDYGEYPVFKVWVEQVAPEDFATYKDAIIQDLKEYEPGQSAAGDNVTVEKFMHKNHEYYLYLRNDLSYEALKGNNSTGGAYVFFPEKNTTMFIFLFNTKYNSPDAFLLTKEAIKQAIEEFIDSATAENKNT